MKLISIIIPYYKKRKYIQNSLKSICKQIYKMIEIVSFNDHPKKNSFSKIIKSKFTKIVKTNKRKRSNFDIYNQMNSYYEGFIKNYNS